MDISKNIMGVMNVTPNSFSDGGRFIESSTIEAQIENFKKLGVYYLDIGAESTAPMNDAISADEEWQRLEKVIAILKEELWAGVVSLDTYKPEIANAFFKELSKSGYNDSQFLWNDVSGEWDGEVEDFLNRYPSSRYVFCHNEAPSREKTSLHMDFVKDGANEECFSRLKEYFKKADTSQYGERVVLDPCFGFSKTYEQNWYLIENFPLLMESFEDHDFVFGVSRKSFLRKWWQENVNSYEEKKENLLQKSEILHASLLRDLFKKCSSNKLKKAIFRLHDPEIAIYASR